MLILPFCGYFLLKGNEIILFNSSLSFIKKFLSENQWKTFLIIRKTYQKSSFQRIFMETQKKTIENILFPSKTSIEKALEIVSKFYEISLFSSFFIFLFRNFCNLFCNPRKHLWEFSFMNWNLHRKAWRFFCMFLIFCVLKKENSA